MKILFLSSLYSPHIGGGAEIVLQRTVEGMHQRGHEVCVLSTGPDAGLKHEYVKGVKVYRAGLLNTYWHFSEQRPGALARLGWHLRDKYNMGMRTYLRDVLAAEKVDLVVCHNLSGWSVSAWDEISASGVPLVQVLHDMYLMCPSSNMFKKNAACKTPCTLCKHFRQGHAERSAQVDAVVGVSQHLLGKLADARFFRNASQQVIHNASPKIDHAPSRFARLDQAEPLRFGYLGTLSEPKGLRWLIDQFKRLPFNATLQIAGRGQLDYEQLLKQEAGGENIHFVGYQSPETFYRQIDVAIVPSIWNEPFGLVAVEACAHSVPVIASARGGLPEIIQDGVNGLLCNPDEPQTLGLAMLQLYRDPELRERLAAQARDSVEHLLDQERMLDSYQQLFLDVLQRRNVHHEISPVTQSL
ncbi:glycosyltransferase family 4 protein [Pseudomonas sp. CFBP 13710]|uniref:glycosyltransferase family 4 protein n=1 Tax=Pseudomonas sp. CFBP 13710 TaxID=2775311 RepID=UPI0017812A88|nr:glycosyltransferase family 4 protein [Pseudomonas sp. CFBP 13710]MBD8733277.1 glycosyltransferase family 4 protein [Pseudomonas sp. CFBP 13710]